MASTVTLITMIVIIVLASGFGLLALLSNVIASALYFVANIATLYVLDLIAKLLNSTLFDALNSAFTGNPAFLFLSSSLAGAASSFVVLLLFVFLTLTYLLIYFAILKKYIRPIGLKNVAYRIFDKSFSLVFGVATGGIFALMAVFALTPVAEATSNVDEFNNNTAVKIVRKYESIFPGLDADQHFSISIKEFVDIIKDPSNIFNEDFLKAFFDYNIPELNSAVKDYISGNEDQLLDKKVQDQIMKKSQAERDAIYKQFEDRFGGDQDFLDKVKDILGVDKVTNYYVTSNIPSLATRAFV